MFKIQKFFEYLKKRSLPRCRLAVPEGGSRYSRNGLIEAMRLGGCTSCLILSDDPKMGAVTDFRPIHSKDHLAELMRLTQRYSELANANSIALSWDGQNRKSRYDRNGNVHKLYSGLQQIFKGRYIQEIFYPGGLDWIGLDIDNNVLIIK